MASNLVNLVKIAANSVGTGAITLGSAAEGYRGLEALTNGVNYGYSIQQNGAWEFGRGTYLASTGQLVRSPLASSDGGTAINLRQGAEVAFVALAEDLDAVVLTSQMQAAAAETEANAEQVAIDRAAIEALFGQAPRERLTTDRIYYVRTDGSDSNNGLTNTAGGAFLTVQKAVDTAYKTLDCNGRSVTISLAAGTYSGTLRIYGKLVGAKGNLWPLTIVGNEASPSTVVVTVDNNDLAALDDFATVLFKGIKFTTTTAGTIWSASNGAVIEHQNCILGPSAGEVITSFYHATIRARGPTTVVGGGVSFVHATKRSIVDFNNQTITFSGAPVFTTYLWGLNDASLHLDDATIVGAVTGPILVHDRADMNVTGLTGSYLGGSAPLVLDGGMIISNLYAARVFYVRKDGSDGNDGLADSPERAFLTIQAAVDAVAKLSYDPAIWTNNDLSQGCAIAVHAGVYAETVHLRDTKFVGVTLLGDSATTVTIAGAQDGVSISGINTKWFVQNVTITAAAGHAVRVENGSQVTLRDVKLGTTSNNHLHAAGGSRIICDGNYSITGAAIYHAFADMCSSIDLRGITVTLTGTPAFNTFAFVTHCSVLNVTTTTFTGSATGTRYIVGTNGVIDTSGGGSSFLPGNAAGSALTGGQYA